MKANKSTKVVKQPRNVPQEVFMLIERRLLRDISPVPWVNKPYSMSFDAWKCHRYSLPDSPFYAFRKDENVSGT